MNNNANELQFILECTNLSKSYTQVVGENLVILNEINLKIGIGDTLSIVGSSGSGKSTLLHILAGLDKASSGDIWFDGQCMSNLNDNQVCSIRNTKLGFVYQFHYLLPEFTAIENILMPLFIRNDYSQRDYGLYLLDRLGLSGRINHYPSQLSGGERQRVAIARAIINNPKLVFADEPTGNLDNQTGNSVLEIFFELQKELKTSLIIVTHDIDIAKKTHTSYRLHDGVLSPIIL